MAFLLNEYRPFGGMPRDCLRLAREAASRGHSITILTRAWQGERPQEPRVNLVLLGIQGLTNAAHDRHFTQQCQDWLTSHPQDLVLGFHRMPGLTAYFAADPCFEAKIRRLKPAWFRWTPRYRRFAKAEKAVFEAGRTTQVLLLHPGEIATYQALYGTEPERLHVLPPGIQRPNLDDLPRDAVRQSVREELEVAAGSPLILLAGSGFRTKGLDRALIATAAHDTAHLVIAGQDKPAAYLTQAEQLGIASRVHFIGGRTDLNRWMVGSDILIHPAYSENTGTVLVEALAHGLPTIASAVCGFASHVRDAQGGVVLTDPFSQGELNDTLQALLGDSQRLETMGRAGRAYAASQDLYSCHQRAVDLLERFSQTHTD